MADVKLATTALQTLITGGAFADADRDAGDYDNGTALDLFCQVYLTLQYSAAPTAGDPVAQLWVLPGDGAGTEVFPNGGDGTVGDDNDPQGHFFVGQVHTVAPSTTVDEVLSLPYVKLFPNGNRFVVKNVSGASWDSGWTLKIKPFRYQVS